MLNTEFYLRLRAAATASSQLRESGGSPAPAEHLLQRIWLHQRLHRQQLRTLDGHRLVVLHPGFWNHEAGPDFRDAVLQFGAQAPVTGDVELDLQPANWHGHGHVDNPAYRGVRLHVVWQGESAAAEGLPTLCLAGVLDSPLQELAEWLGGFDGAGLPPGLEGRCAAQLAALPAAERGELVAQAALVRLEAKARQLEARARETGLRQALWEAMLGALGYKQNFWPMRRLGEVIHLDASLPLTAAQAVLLGVGGLLPAELPRRQSEGDAYLRELWDVWWRERHRWLNDLLPRAVWRLHGLRPANHPQRRLALAGHWLAAPGWADQVEDWAARDGRPADVARGLRECLQGAEDAYWSWHWNLTSARLGRSQPLLGDQRVTDLAVNVILPWLWLRASRGGNPELERQLQARYLAWPAGEDNAVLRRLRQRMTPESWKGLPRTAATQQGLLQIWRDFCEHTNSLCQDCRLPELLR